MNLPAFTTDLLERVDELRESIHTAIQHENSFDTLARIGLAHASQIVNVCQSILQEKEVCD